MLSPSSVLRHVTVSRNPTISSNRRGLGIRNALLVCSIRVGEIRPLWGGIEPTICKPRRTHALSGLQATTLDRAPTGSSRLVDNGDTVGQVNPTNIQDNGLIACIKAAQELAETRLLNLKGAKNETAAVKAKFKADLHKLSDALTLQQNMLEDQQALHKRLLEEHVAAKQLEGEAIATKLKGQIVESDSKLKEMADRLLAVQRELDDSKMLHHNQITALEASATRAASDAANQMALLRAQLDKAEALLVDQQQAWQSELKTLGASHLEAIQASNKEYIDAVEGFEWMIKELQTECQSLQTSLNLSKDEAQRQLQEREAEIFAAHRAEIESLVKNQREVVAVDTMGNAALVLDLEGSLAAAKSDAERERSAMLSELSDLNDSSRTQIEELQKKCEWFQSRAEAAEAERARISQHLELAEDHLAASELRVLGLQAELSRAEEEKAALSAKIDADVVTQSMGQRMGEALGHSNENQMDHHNHNQTARAEVEAIRMELLRAEEVAAENVRLLNEAEFELLAAFEAKQKMIIQAEEMASEHALIQARLQEELETLRQASVRAEADSTERTMSLQSGLHTAELVGKQESKALRDEMDQLARNSVSVQLMMEEQLRLAQAKLSEAQKELEDLRISASAREADLLQSLETSKAELKWEKFVLNQAARDNGPQISSIQQQPQVAATSKKTKGKGSQPFKDAFQSLSRPAKQRNVVVETVVSAGSPQAATASSAAALLLSLGGVPHPVPPIPETPLPACSETDNTVSTVAVEVAASLRNAWSAAEVLANTAAVKLQSQEAEAERRIGEIGRQLEGVQRELEERKTLQVNQETAFESQKLLFLEQQSIVQSLLEEEKESRKIETEALAALKQAQEAEAMARLGEMAAQLAAVQRELEESKASHSNLASALMSKEALFSEQQVALQSFVEEQREVKMLAFEAAAEKLKGQAEAEARLEEMAGRMAAQQREFEDFKKSHLQQIAALEARANQAAAAAADEIARLQAEKLMAETVVSGQQEVWMSELDSIGLVTERLLNRTKSSLGFRSA